MKRATVCFLMLAGVVCAGATVRVFITSSAEPYGLDDRTLSCTPTWIDEEDPPHEGQDCDHYQVTGFPPFDYPSGTCGNGTGLICPGDCNDPFTGGYIWLQFQNEPDGARINGLVILVRECASDVPATCVYPTYYVLNDRFNSGYKRWDGTATPPEYAEWHRNPWPGVAVTADGISNLDYDEPCNLYHGETHTALLGAIVCSAAGTPHARDFRVEITNVNYEDPSQPVPYVEGGAFSLFDLGDLNCDGSVNFADINPFVQILSNPTAWQTMYPDCPFATGDINTDGSVNFGDINPFVALLTAR